MVCMMYCRLPFLYEMHVILRGREKCLSWGLRTTDCEKQRKLTKNCYEYLEYVAHTPSKPVPTLDISSFSMKTLHEVCQVSHRKVL